MVGGVAEIPQTVAIGGGCAQCAADAFSENLNPAVGFGFAFQDDGPCLGVGIGGAAACVGLNACDFGCFRDFGVNGQVQRRGFIRDVACQIGGRENHRIAAIGQVGTIGVELPAAVVERCRGAQENVVGHHADEAARLGHTLQLWPVGLGVKTDKTVDVDLGFVVDRTPGGQSRRHGVEHDVQHARPAGHQCGTAAGDAARRGFYAGLEAKCVALACAQS